MSTLSNARVSAFSPLSLGIFVAGVLMFVVIAIVRSVTNQPSDIGATTAAGLTSIQAPAFSNNVADSLPAFQPAPSTEPLPEFYPPATTTTVESIGGNAQMTEEEYAAALGAPQFKTIDGNPWVGIAPETNVAGSGWYPCSAVITTGFPAAFQQQALEGCGRTYTAPVRDAAWDNHNWLAVAYGPGDTKWVYGGAWFDCRHINASALTYATVGGDPALVVWGELAPRKQSDVAKECQS
jgi:hypothetical protein